MQTKKIAILGTGMVGRAHAGRLLELGYEVVMGTRDVEATLAKTESGPMGTPPFKVWHQDHAGVQLLSMNEVAAFGEVVFNTLKGEISLQALSSFASELEGKILIDVANPLDFSNGMPPSLSVCNTDSLAEQLQKALPNTHVVKAFSTLNADLQVRPMELAEGDHHLFICGNDEGAKKTVLEITEAYGWKHVLDLGDITGARGIEMLLPIWLRLWQQQGTAKFNFKIVSESK